MQGESVSIVVSALDKNEEDLSKKIQKIDDALKSSGVEYELIFTETDKGKAVYENLIKLSSEYPMVFLFEKGTRGKVISDGIKLARHNYVAIVDQGGIEFSEALPEMLERLHHGHDIVIAKNEKKLSNFSDKIVDKLFQLAFGQFESGVEFGSRSKIKLFKKKIVRGMDFDYSFLFDLEFLLSAKNKGCVVGAFRLDRIFMESHQEGKFWKSIWDIAVGAVKVRIKPRPPILIHPESQETMKGAGIIHKNKEFITHTTLGEHESAIHTFRLWQKILLAVIFLILFVGILFSPLNAGIIFVGILSFVYFADTFFGLFLVSKSLTRPPEIKSTADELKSLDDKNLPVYTIFCPLYKEAHILPHFLDSIGKLDWPKDKLDVLLLLEEDDKETIQAAETMDIPDYVRTLVVPHSMPKTKPKACNYGLAFAMGKYSVIYDAEDNPDPMQLKKAFLGFEKTPEQVRCLQAKLNYYNSDQNLLTRLFTAEYSLWFDINLPGLQSINTTIPLGGTSNHFYTEDLKSFEGWDPFNVTEDCDLGVRIFKRGYETAIIDSVTLEEANSDLKNWLRQRSRWIKGYMQTYLVHMRDPIDFLKKSGRHAFIFQLIVGGKIAFMLINPILWMMTIAYFVLNSTVGPTIEALYPPVIFYMAGTSLVLGNFLYIYYYMIGCAKRGHWPIIKYVFFIPFYWILVSVAALIALYQLLVKPHYWEKTNHGLHLKKDEDEEKKRF